MLYDQHLPEQADRILAAGFSVVVDATFLHRDQRRRMEDLARQRGVPYLILACVSSPEQARRRLVERQALGGDPSDADGAVLDAQFRTVEPLDGHERDRCLEVGAPISPQDLIAAVAARLAGPGQPRPEA
jgi:predicted kinase